MIITLRLEIPAHFKRVFKEVRIRRRERINMIDLFEGPQESRLSFEKLKLRAPFAFWGQSYHIQAYGPSLSLVELTIHYRTPHLLLDFLLYPILWINYRLSLRKRLSSFQGLSFWYGLKF